MKKTLIVLSLFISLMFVFSVVANAADIEDNFGKTMSEQIVNDVNTLYGISITEKSINYEKAVKVYVDTNIFDLATNNFVEMRKILESGNYVYVLPIYTDSGTIVITFQRGLPLNSAAKSVLTLEEQNEIITNEGHWIISALTIYRDNAYNEYLTVLTSRIEKSPEDVLLVGSLPVFEDVVALVSNDKGSIEQIIPVTNYEYNYSLLVSAEKSDGVYSYSKVKSLYNEHKDEWAFNDEDSAGGTGIVPDDNSTCYIALFGVLFVLVAMTMIVLYTRERSKNT